MKTKSCLKLVGCILLIGLVQARHIRGESCDECFRRMYPGKPDIRGTDVVCHKYTDDLSACLSSCEQRDDSLALTTLRNTYLEKIGQRCYLGNKGVEGSPSSVSRSPQKSKSALAEARAPLRRSITKRPPTKKPPTKKPTIKKTQTKKPRTKRSPTKKPPTKKTTTKRPSTKKPPTRRPSGAALKEGIKQMMRDNRDLIPRFVQLTFHDCWDGCNGCLDLTDASNKDLISVVDILRSFRDRSAPDQSLADIFVLAGISALEFSSNNSVTVPFSFGRQDCTPSNPKTIKLTKGFRRDAVQLLIRAFGLNNKEGVALLGAHTLGNMHTGISGYGEGPWDITPHKFDNGYFIDLTGAFDAKFEHQFVNNSNIKSTQWKGTVFGSSTIFMMHCDMALMKRFNIRNVGGNKHVPSCAYDKCRNASTSDIVREFAKDLNGFKRSFISAFSKMISKKP